MNFQTLRICIVGLGVFCIVGSFAFNGKSSAGLYTSLIPSLQGNSFIVPDFKTETNQNTSAKQMVTFTEKNSTDEPAINQNKIVLVHAGDPNVFKITSLKDKLVDQNYHSILKADSSQGIMGAHIFIKNGTQIQTAQNIKQWLTQLYPHLDRETTIRDFETFRQMAENGRIQNKNYQATASFYKFNRNVLYQSTSEFSDVADIIVVIGK